MSQLYSESHPQMLKFIFLKCCPEIFLNYDWGTLLPIFLNLTSCVPCDVTYSLPVKNCYLILDVCVCH